MTDNVAALSEKPSDLLVELVMQDGSIAETRIADTVHNRQLQDYIARHESFALIHARQHLESQSK